MTTALKTIFQDNAVTKSRQEFSALEKNVFYMLLAALDDSKKRFHYISVSEMCDKTGVHVNYDQYELACYSMVGKTISIKKEDSKSGNALDVSMIASAEYMKGEGLIELEISDKLKPYLFDLKNNFTSFQLEMALSMKSKYSKRIYEMVAQYKTVEYFAITLDELRHRLGLENSYPLYADFNKRVLVPAIKEINDYSDIETSCSIKKRGRKVHSLVFLIKYKPNQTKITFKDENKEVFDRMVNKYGLSKEQAQAVLQKHDKDYVNKILFEIQSMVASNQIKSVGGYTAKRFDVVYAK